MQHVNFVNSPTYHIYQWIVARKLDTSEAIATAFDNAAKTEPMLELDTLDTVTKELAVFLSEWFEEQIYELTKKDQFPLGFMLGDTMLYDFDHYGTETLDAIILPFVAHVFQMICWDSIAEALLRDAGKWNPERKPDAPPEIE